MDRLKAIYNTHANAVRTNNEGAWDKDDKLISLDEDAISTEMIRLQDEYDALQYQRDRQYPSIGDQLDMQYWDQVNGTTTWKDAVAKVKSDNPK